MATNGVYYSQYSGFTISTNNTNRVIVTTGGTTIISGDTLDGKVIDVRGINGSLFSVDDNIIGNILSVINTTEQTIFNVNDSSVGIGINGEPPTNRLHISASTDPIRVVGFQESSDDTVITIDGSGVLHKLPISSISGITITGTFLPLSGGTVIGDTIFQSGLTANTISATTYFNYPDSHVTGFTLDNNTDLILSQNRDDIYSSFTISLSGISVIGEFLPISGGTVTGDTIFQFGLSADTIYATNYQNLPNNVTGNYLPLSGGSLTGGTIFQSGLTANTISATTYQNLPDNVTGRYLPLSGGTVTGRTIFQSGLTANTISATTYQNLPNTLYTGNGTLSGSRTVNQSFFSLTFNGTGNSLFRITNNFVNGGSQSSATGQYSHAEGTSASSGDYSHAEGNQTTSTGAYSHSEGFQTISNGVYSHAEGNQTTSFGTNSHAEGSGTTSYGGYSHSEGFATYSTGIGSHAEGSITTSYGTYSHSEGFSTYSNGIGSHSEGYSGKSIGDYSHVEGSSFYVNTNESIDISTVTSIFFISDGGYIFEFPVDSFSNNDFDVVGNLISLGIVFWPTKMNNLVLNNTFKVNNCYYGLGISSGAYSSKDNKTTFTFSPTYPTCPQTLYSVSGCGIYSVGQFSHAEGVGTVANGDFSHTEGLGTVADGKGQHVSGRYNTTGNTTSLSVIGNGTEDDRSDLALFNLTGVRFNGYFENGATISASGMFSHAEGTGTIASGDYSHSEGAGFMFNNEKILIEDIFTYQDDFGEYSGFVSFNQNYFTVYGCYSLSTPYTTSFLNLYNKFSSTTINVNFNYYSPITITNVNCYEVLGPYGSHFETSFIFETPIEPVYYQISGDSYVRANGLSSHAEGLSTIADGDYQHVSGKYNVSGNTSSLFVVGNGSDDINRSDILNVNPSEVVIFGGLSAQTISATTYYNLPINYFISGSTPSGVTINYGDRWYNTNNGIELVYITDGNSNQWVQPANTPGPPGYSNLMITSGITTSAITLDINTNYYGVNYNGNVNLTLPNPSGYDGYNMTIKDEGGYSSTYRIRLTPLSGLIDGNSYVDMNLNYMALHLVARNNNWWII